MIDTKHLSSHDKKVKIIRVGRFKGGFACKGFVRHQEIEKGELVFPVVQRRSEPGCRSEEIVERQGWGKWQEGVLF